MYTHKSFHNVITKDGDIIIDKCTLSEAMKCVRALRAMDKIRGVEPQTYFVQLACRMTTSELDNIRHELRRKLYGDDVSQFHQEWIDVETVAKIQQILLEQAGEILNAMARRCGDVRRKDGLYLI